jgi:hypothetical protein
MKHVQIEGTTQNFFSQKVVLHRTSHLCHWVSVQAEIKWSPITAEDEDDDERVRASFLHSPKKSMATAAKELSIAFDSIPLR